MTVLWGLAGLGGVAYILVTVRRMRRQTTYQPVFEDWLFHALLPFAAYLLMGVAAALASAQSPLAPFLAGGATLVLLFVGIHNAWDAVTYHVLTKSREPQVRTAISREGSD